jgi:hypothetical protein
VEGGKGLFLMEAVGPTAEYKQLILPFGPGE